MRDVEALIANHMAHQTTHSKLSLLVPSVGRFFTPLPLAAAFEYQDAVRHISRRRFVAPSFNDVRLVLNTAQAMAVCAGNGLGSIDEHSNPACPLALVTFDGDLTLYDDGASLAPSNPVIPRIIQLMARDVRIAIVTAAGYTDASRYHGRLAGLLSAVATSPLLNTAQRLKLCVMGGESNYLFRFAPEAACLLEHVPESCWRLDEMRMWSEGDIEELLNVAETAFRECVEVLEMDAMILRKPRAAGIVPMDGGRNFLREQLEETVLVLQQVLVRRTMHSSILASGRRITDR